MHSFRAFAQSKATWILNYSWDGDKKVDAREAMMNLAMSQVMAGANFWDAPGHSMAGSNDLATRKKIFDWIGEHEKTFYLPRSPIDPIGVYFSPGTRNFYAQEFINAYRGVLILLMQKHLEFQIVTPRNLAEFHGPTMIMPQVRVLGEDEKKSLQLFVEHGQKLVITGTDTATGVGSMANVIRFPNCPGTAYNLALEKDFEHASPDSEQAFLASLQGSGAVKIKAGPDIATSIAKTSDGHINVYFANFAGLPGGPNLIATPQTDVEVSVVSKSDGQGFFLPFLGSTEALPGTRKGDSMSFVLPTINRGAVFWYEP
jgi:hypothetical protein